MFIITFGDCYLHLLLRKLSNHVTGLHCLCNYKSFNYALVRTLFHIVSRNNEKFTKKILIVEMGLVEPHKGRLVEQ